jgi:hypothetical protein
VEQDGPEAVAARERQAAMVEQLRKAELVRDRLASLQELVGPFPEGHDTRALLEDLHLDRALRAVEDRHRVASGGPHLPPRYLRSAKRYEEAASALVRRWVPAR